MSPSPSATSSTPPSPPPSAPSTAAWRATPRGPPAWASPAPPGSASASASPPPPTPRSTSPAGPGPPAGCPTRRAPARWDPRSPGAAPVPRASPSRARPDSAGGEEFGRDRGGVVQQPARGRELGRGTVQGPDRVPGQRRLRHPGQRHPGQLVGKCRQLGRLEGPLRGGVVGGQEPAQPLPGVADGRDPGGKAAEERPQAPGQLEGALPGGQEVEVEHGRDPAFTEE